ncbi:cob(I)yrinic acid a,c-diamide adenosyltransferase [Symbiobacterium thermophilum]|uniref:Corrinoid adenosyltransferase n=1 Tax=Symbiobacterium thermophilum TaxID=2734 RepID=A0A953HZ44_SYMTR|nr:cob(I)yrinic acid a,c-diamide adenosyltransferase [Symbiobacterium thermophilum]MBY6275297.1 ATP:cob(I)alamin adenosyltransferase [Symbiobacterium thermophilum]
MRIYTRTGDKGDTSLRWGERVPKNALRVEVYGTVDEANAHVGMAVAMMEGPAFAAVRDVLLRVQNELFYVGADLATPPNRDRGEQPRITQASVDALEADIDRLEAGLPPLRNFVLPGGSAPAAALHVARTVVRRAERLLVSLMQQEPVDPALLRYLNRLSDLLFVAARAANQAAGHGDALVDWNRSS